MRCSRWLFSGTAVVVLLLGSATAYTRTIRVSQDGTEDFCTIQMAVNAAEDGDIIRVLPGVYDGQVKITPEELGTGQMKAEAITIIGSGRDSTIIRSSSGFVVYARSGYFLPSGGGQEYYEIELTMRNLAVHSEGEGGFYLAAEATLDNCEVQGGDYGIVCFDTVELSRIACRGSRVSCLQLSGRYARQRISDCTFSHSKNGVYINESANVSLRHCTASTNTGYGIYGCDGAQIQVHRSSVYDNEQGGIVLYGAMYSEIVGSEVARNSGVGLAAVGTPVRVSQSSIHDNKGNGVEIREGDLQCVSSTIAYNTEDGVHIADSTVTFTNNVVAGNGGEGLDVTDLKSHVSAITHNNIWANASGSHRSETAGFSWQGNGFGVPQFADLVSSDFYATPWTIRPTDSEFLNVGPSLPAGEQGTGRIIHMGTQRIPAYDIEYGLRVISPGPGGLVRSAALWASWEPEYVQIRGEASFANLATAMDLEGRFAHPSATWFTALPDLSLAFDGSFRWHHEIRDGERFSWLYGEGEAILTAFESEIALRGSHCWPGTPLLTEASLRLGNRVPLVGINLSLMDLNLSALAITAELPIPSLDSANQGHFRCSLSPLGTPVLSAQLDTSISDLVDLSSTLRFPLLWPPIPVLSIWGTFRMAPFRVNAWASYDTATRVPEGGVEILWATESVSLQLDLIGNEAGFTVAATASVDWFEFRESRLLPNSPPITDCIPKEQRAEIGQRVHFSSTESTDPDGLIMKRVWEFGDDHTALGSDVSHIYDSPGQYIVAITTTDNRGASTTAYGTVLVTAPNLPPEANFEWRAEDEVNGDSSSLVAGQAVRFIGQTSTDTDGRITLYEWDWGSDGFYDETSTAATIQHVFAIPGTVDVTLRVTDNRGAVSTTAHTLVIVTPLPPTAVFEFSPTESNTLRAVKFTDRSLFVDGAVVAWSWDFGDDSPLSSEQFPEHLYERKGSFEVTLEVTDEYGLRAHTSRELVVANEEPAPRFTWHPAEPRAGELVYLDASQSYDPDGVITDYIWRIDGQVEHYTSDSMWWHAFGRDGVYQVSMTVRDDDNVSRTVEEYVTVAPLQDPIQPSDTWALVIGISDYESVEDAMYCRDDALAFYEWLAESDVPLENVRLLTDCSDDQTSGASSQTASLAHILGGLSWLARSAQENDLVLFYFAGHGYRWEDDGTDEDDGVDEFLVVHDTMSDSIAETALRDDDLAKWIGRIESRHVVLLLDSCYSGGQSRNISGGKRPLTEKSDGLSDAGLREQLVLSAATEYQEAQAAEEFKHGAFTYLLLEGLKTGEADMNRDSLITLEEVFSYVRRDLPQLVRESSGMIQEPTLTGDGHRGIVIGDVP